MRWRLTAVVSVSALLLLVVVPTGAVEPEQRTVTAQVRVNPLEVELLLPDRPFRAGQPITVRARVRNHGTTTVENVVAVLHLSEAHLEARDGTVRDLRHLPPGRHVFARWQLCTPRPGVYLVLARVVAELDGASIEMVTPARQFAVDAPPGRAPGSCAAW